MSKKYGRVYTCHHEQHNIKLASLLFTFNMQLLSSLLTIMDRYSLLVARFGLDSVPNNLCCYDALLNIHTAGRFCLSASIMMAITSYS